MTAVHHNANCKRVFARYDPDCPRCEELTNGAPPRKGWGDLKKRNEAARTKAIANHDFTACANKNFVCTCFDW